MEVEGERRQQSQCPGCEGGLVVVTGSSAVETTSLPQLLNTADQRLIIPSTIIPSTRTDGGSDSGGQMEDG